MNVHPISHVIFETTWAGFIQILHHCTVLESITPPYFFSSNIIYFGQKLPIEVKFFELLSGRVKIHQIPPVFFGTKSQFF